MAVFFLLTNTHLSAQQKEITTASITGSVMVSTDGKSVFYNMGGPSVKIAYKKWFAAATMFPSLRFFDSKGTINVNPILGTGITFGYKRYMIGFPCYYLSTKNIWIFTAGAGIRLGK
jgi:hypothetical protein